MRCRALLQVTVLDKSRSDWKDFKTTNEELEEELETYKKSSGTVGAGPRGTSGGWPNLEWAQLGSGLWGWLLPSEW